MKKACVFVIIISMVFSSIGCAARGQWKQVGGGAITGAMLGAVGGAAAGATLYKKDRSKGALVGAIGGALLGSLIGGIGQYKKWAAEEAAKTGEMTTCVNEEKGIKIQADPPTSYEEIYVDVPDETASATSSTTKGVSTGEKKTKKVKKTVAKVRVRTWESGKLTSDTYERVPIN